MNAPCRIEALGPQHDRAAFDCGAAPLDRYIREQASQDIRRMVAKCFVAVEPGQTRIAGFYTLAAASLPLDLLPAELKRKLPRYPTVPVARVGRLAVDQSRKGQKLGAALLADALLRAGRAEMGVYALIVDAKDDLAEAFYLHHGFLGFAPRQLFLPLASLTLG